MKLMDKTILLTHYIPPYRVPLYHILQDALSEFKVFVSTHMEKNREWKHDLQNLNVTKQRTITLQRIWKHPSGFKEISYQHFPLDTFYLLLREQPDVVISTEFGARTIQAAIFCKLRNVKLIIWAKVSERSEEGRSWIRTFIRKQLVKMADSIIVNGKSGVRYIASLGRKLDRGSIIPYVSGIDATNACTRDRKVQGVRKLVYVGQLSERKGIVRYLECLSEWLSTNPDFQVEFNIIGDGPLRGDIDRIPGLSNLHINIIGHVPYDAIPEHMLKSDILVFPTLADEWGLVVNEALAFCLPVLGSVHSQAVEELIRDDWNGWTFDPDSIDSIMETFPRVFTLSEDKLVGMSENAKRSVEHLTPEYAAHRIIRVIEG